MEGPVGEREIWGVLFVNAIEEGGREGAKSTEMVDSEGEKVETIVVEVLDVGDRELCADTVMVCSKCGLRMRLVGEQTRGWGQRGFRDMRNCDVNRKISMSGRCRG